MQKLHYNGQLQEITEYPSFYRARTGSILICNGPNDWLFVVKYTNEAGVKHYGTECFGKEDELTKINPKEAIGFVMESFSIAMGSYSKVFKAMETKPSKPENKEMEAGISGKL